MKCPPSPTQEQKKKKEKKEEKKQNNTRYCETRDKHGGKTAKVKEQEIIIGNLFWRLKALYNLMKNMQGTNTHVQINGI